MPDGKFNHQIESEAHKKCSTAICDGCAAFFNQPYLYIYIYIYIFIRNWQIMTKRTENYKNKLTQCELVNQNPKSSHSSP